MTFVKGKSGNPGGRGTEKQFTDALRLELNKTDASGKKALRRITEKLVDCALAGDAWAVQQVADRLDGKPAQDSTVTIEKRDATDWSLSELVALFHERRAARARDITPGGSTAELN